MSISGRLDDVSVAEVLQFIHLGSRSGTLLIQEGAARAEVEFQRGRIVTARSSESLRLGELLVVKGLIDRRALLRAVEHQRGEARGRVLGEVLLSVGAVKREDLLAAVTEHVEQTIMDVVGWSTGVFRFAVDELRPLRGSESQPGEVFPNVDLNTQMVLLEAARIMDERATSGPKVGAASPKATDADLEEVLEDSTTPEAEPQPEEPRPKQETRKVAIISSDDIFVGRVSTALKERGFDTDRFDFDMASALLESSTRPVAIVEIPGEDLEGLRTLHHRKPGTALIAVSDAVRSITEVVRAGAIAYVHAEPLAVVACVENVYDLHKSSPPKLKQAELHGASLELLRKMSKEIRTGLLSTGVALVLLRILSETVERALLFFLTPESMVLLGGFGSSTIEPGRPVAELLKGLRVSMDEESVLLDAIIDRRPREISTATDRLPVELLDRVGEPANGQAVLLPILGAERVILLVWVDNGDNHRPIRDVDILDLIAGQVGVAIENQLLRNRLSGNGS